MKSGNNGNKCVSVKKRLKIQYFRDFTEQKLLSYKLFGRYSIILQRCFCRRKNVKLERYKKKAGNRIVSPKSAGAYSVLCDII